MLRTIITFFFLFITLTYSIFPDTWYVRPTAENYGDENGTSYANAWDGLENVIWGTGGVKEGDTLYVCGFHLHTHTGPPNSLSIFPISGSPGSRVIIRGDYPGDPGVIWGGAIMSHGPWIYEGSNTYHITIPKDFNNNWFFEDVTAESWVTLDEEDSIAACQANPGSYYSPDYAYGSKLYVHCSDDSAPTGRIVGNRLGYKFAINGLSYITWKDLGLYEIYQWLDQGATPPHSIDNMTWEDCTMWYGDGACIILFRDTSHHVTFDGCDIAWASNGIGFAEKIHGGNSETHDWLITGCTIHDIGIRPPNKDAHAVSVQGTRDGVIEHCEMYNAGSTICFYIPSDATIVDCSVRYNYIHHAHTQNNANGRGIAFNLGRAQNAGSTGNKIYGNIVANCIDGIRVQWHDEVKVYNNVVYNSTSTNYLYDRHDYEIRVVSKNNISLSPGDNHVYFRAGATEGNFYLDSSHNCYYPVSGSDFRYDDLGGQALDLTFAQWRALSKTGCTFDLYNLQVNPNFTNSTGNYSNDTDFQLQPDSPAIDAGVNMQLIQDRNGILIPQGFAPDIGAYECAKPIYIKISASPYSGDIPLTVEFEGDAMGDYPPFNYSWNFGDGVMSNEQNLSHTYTSEGEYQVTLAVADNEDNMEYKTLLITAYSPIKSLEISSITGQPAPGEGGTTNPLPGMHLYSRGSIANVKALPNTNYRFSNWAGDVDDSVKYAEDVDILIDIDKSIKANFYTKCGDVNGDLRISPADAQQAFEFFLGRISNPTEYQKENADVNCDGTKNAPNVTPSDAQAIFEFYLGRSQLPCDCSNGSRSDTQSANNRNTSEITLVLNDNPAYSGDEIAIPVVAENKDFIKAFGLDISFPSESLEYVTIEKSGFSEEFNQIDANIIAPGILRVGGFRTKFIRTKPSNILVILIFKVRRYLNKAPIITIENSYDDTRSSYNRKEKLRKKTLRFL